EDGIRDRNVTGVQTCALPISQLIGEVAGDAVELGDDLRPQLGAVGVGEPEHRDRDGDVSESGLDRLRRMLDLPAAGRLEAVAVEIGRASCRERVYGAGRGRSI